MGKFSLFFMVLEYPKKQELVLGCVLYMGATYTWVNTVPQNESLDFLRS